MFWPRAARFASAPCGRRARGPLRLAVASAGAALFLAGCATAPAPEPPAPPPEFTGVEVQPPTAPAPPPEEYIRVTAGKANVRQGPGVDQPVIAKVRRGDRLRLRGSGGDWFEVVLADGRPGFLRSDLARRDEPCPPDDEAPLVLTPPQLSFSSTDNKGVVRLRVEVDADGAVARATVAENTTGDPALAQQAVAEVSGMKFAPLHRRCRPTAFVYLFTRSF